AQNASCALDEAHDALEEQELWPSVEPIVYAPPAAIESAKESFAELQLWMHPATRLVEGRPLHRPLHATLLTIQYAIDDEPQTLVVVGSANASRAALLRTAASGGNVELCVALRVDGAHGLRDLCPELVAVPIGSADIKEREYPELAENWALSIRGIVYDAASKALVVEWDTEHEHELPAWSLTYRDDVLANGPHRPAASTVITPFELHRSSAELSLLVGDTAYPIPVLIRDLVDLPSGPGEGLLGLRERPLL